MVNYSGKKSLILVNNLDKCTEERDEEKEQERRRRKDPAGLIPTLSLPPNPHHGNNEQGTGGYLGLGHGSVENSRYEICHILIFLSEVCTDFVRCSNL